MTVSMGRWGAFAWLRAGPRQCRAACPRICRGWGDPGRLREAAGLIGENDLPILSREATVAAFSEATGLSIAQTIVLLSTCARTTSWPRTWALGRITPLAPGDAELARAWNLTPGGDGYHVRLRPSRLAGPDDPMLQRLATALTRSGAAGVHSMASDLRFLCSDACVQEVDRMERTP